VKVKRAEAGFDIELHVLVMDRLAKLFLLGCEPDHAQLGWRGIRECREIKKQLMPTFMHTPKVSLVLSVAPDHVHDDTRERERESEKRSESERGT
jgi:hypothetical protein